jgi:signal transduction histidine kinase
VRDYGAGIDPIHHERVFKPFRRLVNKEKTDGSGIGLTAVKRLIQRIGGSVSLESNVNQGASFLIRFPFSQGEKTSL